MELLKRFEGHDLEPGTVIIREGDAGQGLFVILLGEVEILNKDAERPRDSTVAKLGAGEVFGEMSLLGDRPTTATVRTLSRTTIMFLGRDYFRRLVSALPPLRQYFEELSKHRRRARVSVTRCLCCARRFPRPARLPRVMTMRRAVEWLKVLRAGPGRAAAGARAGGTAVGRQLQRTVGLSFRRRHEHAPRSYSGGGNYYGGGSGSHFFFLPGWGWGGMGYGGGSLLGTLFVLVAVGIGAAMVMRAVRAQPHGRAGGGMAGLWGAPDDDEAAVVQGRAYLYKLQLALGRSARSVQDRLSEFAAQG